MTKILLYNIIKMCNICIETLFVLMIPSVLQMNTHVIVTAKV